MASAPSEPRAVIGRVDRSGRLVSADPELEALQLDAGARVGERLALPQVAAVARLARKLNIPVTRKAIAGDKDRDYEFSVRAVPDGEDILLTLENWEVSPAAAPRLSSVGPEVKRTANAPSALEWATDQELKLTSASADLIEALGLEADRAVGQPITRLFRLEENDEGDMPLLSAVALRESFSGQKARTRSASSPMDLVLSGEAIIDASGAFAGFMGLAMRADDSGPVAESEGSPIEQVASTIDEALRTPLDRIVDAADQIRQGKDGPLRSDYAAYANDISTAARHLLSVIASMGGPPRGERSTIDLAALSAEAVLLLEAMADDAGVSIVLEATRTLQVLGEERAVIQILVNLIGNAIRHSPAGGTVTLRFERSATLCRVAVADQGPGIDPADQERIFERFERAAADEDGTGLGLAISRRLARMMGGEISLDSALGRGAVFTLTLPCS